MGWLLSILKQIVIWVAPYGLKLLSEMAMKWWVNYLAQRDEKRKEAALDKSKDQYKQDLQKAGDDAKAQEDAADKFFDSTR